MSIFITGTDTNVGKTLVTTAIAVSLKNSGYSVGVFKPIQTGSFLDTEFVKSTDKNIITKVSYSFKMPAAPSLAADFEDVVIDIDKILSDYEKLKSECDIVLVEGAGGILVPIKDDFLMRDLIKAMDLPLLIVARPDLGTINHTLLTIEAAKAKGIKILGIIISNYPDKTEDLAIKTAPEIIKKHSKEKILGFLPSIDNIENNLKKMPDSFNQVMDELKGVLKLG